MSKNKNKTAKEIEKETIARIEKVCLEEKKKFKRASLAELDYLRAIFAQSLLYASPLGITIEDKTVKEILDLIPVKISEIKRQLKKLEAAD